jgi:hypothetical protein
MSELSGGCQCGTIRYKISGDLGDAVICHCRMCQKAFGSWGAALVDVALKDFKWSRGKPAIFKSSSIVERGFCANCGTPLFMHEQGDPNIEIAIGTFDNPNVIGKLKSQDGVESRLGWFETMHQLPQRRTIETRPQEIFHSLETLQHPDHDTITWPLKPMQP